MPKTYLDYESEARKTWQDIETEFYKEVEEGSAINKSFVQWLTENYKVPVKSI